jgi:hypothetical protein
MGGPEASTGMTCDKLLPYFLRHPYALSLKVFILVSSYFCQVVLCFRVHIGGCKSISSNSKMYRIHCSLLKMEFFLRTVIKD